jgi:homoserine kinase type II
MRKCVGWAAGKVRLVDHASLSPPVPLVLGQFGLRLDGQAEAVPGGSLNWNFRVETDAGRRFVRRYRDDIETERIAGEHDLIRWCAARGIPAPEPAAKAGGDRLADVGGGRWAVFPWIDGVAVERGRLTAARAGALGELHGLTQSVLADHPRSRDARMQLRWDREESLALL